MACLSDETSWFSRSQMLSKKGSLQHQENDNAAENFGLEKIFPLYAVGITKANPNLVASVVDSVCNGNDPIWNTIREEAKLEVESEPILSSFLYANILAHGCLEQALAFVLANRLQNTTLLARHLVDILSDVIMHDRDVQRAIRLDIQAFKERDPVCLSYSSALLNLKSHSSSIGIRIYQFTNLQNGYHSLETYRVAHSLWKQGRKLLASSLQSRVSEVFGVDIHPAAKIGEGIILDHATGVVIGETAVLGNRVSLMQGVTLGGTGKETGDRHPKVGKDALIGARVTILGNIKIGEGAIIAAGSLVLKDVPPHSMVAGIPAKLIGYVTEQDSSLTL